MTRLLAPLLLAFGFVLVTGCPSEPSYPGELLGTLSFNATLTGSNCNAIDVPDAGTRFQATLSRESSGDRAWVTVGTFSRDAGFTGQHLSSFYSANVRFETCGDACAGPELRESLEVTLLSQSQLDALGGACPAPLADGGVPLDGGTPPELAPGRFQAVRACGQLVDVVVPGDGCTCSACTAVYQLDGQLP